MGSGSSRPVSRPSRPPRPNRLKRSSLSSLVICGGSDSHELEDYPSELQVNPIKHGEIVVDKQQSLTSGTGLTSPKTLTGASSESSLVASGIKDPSFDGGLINTETSNQGERLCKSKESVPPHQLSANYRSNDTASNSYEDQSSSDPISANVRSIMDVVNGINNSMDMDTSQICEEGMHPSSSSPQKLGDSDSDEVCVENNASEVMASYNSGASSSFVVSDSPVTSHLLKDNYLQATISPDLGLHASDRERGHRDESVLQVDFLSISSSILSSSSGEISNHETRRNGRRLFWDAFSRRSFRTHNDLQTFAFSTDDTDGVGSHDRCLVDFNGDFFDVGVGGDSGFIGSRIHSTNEQHGDSLSEVWERIHIGRERDIPRISICQSGLHPDGTCSCESVLTADESGSQANISRVVMLAEALFEVLDEIHQQPMSLSLSVVSLPAPEAVVDSFPVKNHKKPERTESRNDAAECYICLNDYEEGDKIRVLPCHHEFHMSCVDKWLKEIHGVCPLCRGDVREGFTDGSASNSETASV